MKTGEFHHSHSVRLCQAHFQRGVEKVTGPFAKGPGSLFDRMMAITRASSEEAYLHQVAALQGKRYP